jgi:2-polyprenyl-3-methyl-5-hydroxy-6-metoxy-1,4-benzoquinol methylase
MSDPCVICGCKESPFGSGDGEYTRCVHCGVLRTRYSYNAEMYGEAYAKNYLLYAESTTNTPLQLFRVGLVSRWLHRGDKILDVGCCVGEFLGFAEKYYSCVGFEPNKKAIAKRRCKAKIHSTMNGMILPSKCITMFDVLEHIEKPREFLKLLFTYLSPGGIFVITTPDVQAVGDKGLKTWKHYKPKEHLFLYSELSLETLVQSVGLQILHWGREESDIRPDNPNGDIMTCVARRPSL